MNTKLKKLLADLRELQEVAEVASGVTDTGPEHREFYRGKATAYRHAATKLLLLINQSEHEHEVEGERVRHG